MDSLLVIKHAQVEGANAIAGLTWGFPAISHFLGFTHALQRKVQAKGFGYVSLNGCAVICHSSQVQSYDNNMSRESYFALTRNPLVLKGKEAVTAPFNEEGKMRMDISLLISVSFSDFMDNEDMQSLLECMRDSVPQMRIAGGVLKGIETIDLESNSVIINENSKEAKRFLRQFLPGFSLVNAHSVLQQHCQQTKQSPLDGLLDFSIRKMTAQKQEEEENVKWVLDRPNFGGWLKPIMVGYQGISDLYQAGEIAHVRDRTFPAQFVESIYSLGQWVSPHRISDIAQLMWTQHYDNAMYLCKNNFQAELHTSINNISPDSTKEN